MKKIFFKEIFLTFIFTLTLFIGLNNVKADSISYSNFYSSFEDLKNYNTYHSDNISSLVSFWEEHYSTEYPYYYIVLDKGLSTQEPSECSSDSKNCNISLYYSSSPSISRNGTSSSFMFSEPLYKCSEGSTCSTNRAYYHISITPEGVISDYNSSDDYSSIPLTFPSFFYSPNSSSAILKALDSNGLLYNPSDNIPSSDKVYTSLIIPSYSSGSTSLPSFEILNSSLLPDFTSLSSGTYDPSNSPNFTEINLNNYSYVILSLKDYTLRNNNNNQFSTPIYTLGSLCITPVYNYGMKEKKDYFSDYNVQACSSTYTSFTPVDVYVLKNDLINHSVYYIKSYSSDTNIIKVDNTIFDITYISSEDEDNPSVIINGRSYPTIPFSDLSQSANLSSENGYVSGQVCALGDINCQAKANGLDISDLFSNPLNLLEEVWDSITSVFGVITSFLGVLPPILQAFLYTSFMLALVIGIIKIVL